ncbi:MAG: hypothetical protein LUO98_07615 [Methanoregula sp.]|nr:hypothetical protein [Methanoregula sp.]
MKYNFSVLTIGLIILLVCIAGCTSTAPPTPEIKLSTVELSVMALQRDELPENYQIKERSEQVRSDVVQSALDLGWKKGYTVKFVQSDSNNLEITSIEQGISVYPIENIDKSLSLQRDESAKYTANTTIDDLSNPNIGDQSQAYRITNKSDNSKSYVIDFVKQDVVESLRMSGTFTDYETLKELAKTAAEKIE